MINYNELLYVVDEFDVATRPLTRAQAHQNGNWHRTAHVWIVNKKGQILCQKRSAKKDSGAGKWEPYAGGHINWPDDYFLGAVKEVREETGLAVEKSDLRLVKIYQDHEFKEFRAVFYHRHDGDDHVITPELEEVDGYAWIDLKDFGRSLDGRADEWIRTGYEKEILPILLGD